MTAATKFSIKSEICLRAQRWGTASWVKAVILLLLLLPVVVADHLPLTDAASHEARIASLRRIFWDPSGSAFYQLGQIFLPNLSFEAMALLFPRSIGPALVGQIFFAITVAATYLGALRLSYAIHRTVNLSAIFSSILIYNLFSSLGFMSYSFSIAIMLFFLSERQEIQCGISKLRQMKVFALDVVFSTILLFSHVGALAVYAVVVGCWEIVGIRSFRGFVRTAFAGMAFIPSVSCFLMMQSGVNAPWRFEYPYLQTKVVNLIKTISAVNFSADIACVLGLGFMAALILASHSKLRSRYALGVTVLFLLYFLIPQHVSGGTYVDQRIPVVAAMIGLISIRIPTPDRLISKLLLMAVFCCIAVKQLALTSAWANSSRTLSEVALRLQALPAGSVLLQADCDPDVHNLRAVYTARQIPLRHAASYAAFDGQHFAAVGFAIPGQQPIKVRAEYQPFKDIQDQVPGSVCFVEGYRRLVEQSLKLLDSNKANGGIVPPLFVLLIRPPHAGLLQPIPIYAELPGPIEIYQVQAH